MRGERPRFSMKPKRKKFWSHDNRFRLLFTLGLAVLLPAGALIYLNFQHLKSIRRDKNVEALIYRDFQYVLGMSEKRLTQKAYAMMEEARAQFPSPNESEPDRTKKLDLLLAKNPWMAHAFLYDHKGGFLMRSQPKQMSDAHFREEHGKIADSFSGWFGMEGKM